MSNKPLRIGIVGCGEIVKITLGQILETKMAKVEWIYNRNLEPAKELAKEVQCKAYDNLVDAANDANTDVVYIATPHSLHYEQACLFLKNKRHLIIEKPITIKSEHALKIIEMCHQKNVSCSTLLHSRQLPAIKMAKQLLDKSIIGKPLYFTLHYLQDRRECYWTQGVSGKARPTSWRHSIELAGGGNLIMNGSHFMDLVNYLLNIQVKAVHGVMQTFLHPVEVEDTLFANLECNNDILGQISFGTAAIGNKGFEFKIFGTEGQIDLSNIMEGQIQLYTKKENDEFPTNIMHEIKLAKSESPRTLHLKEFFTDLLQNKHSLTGAYAGLETALIIEKIYKTLRKEVTTDAPCYVSTL